MPVTASILLTPEDTDDSLIILNKPISPVLETCVPPHNSLEKLLIDTTRTLSSYFSPKSAHAPSALARSKSSIETSSVILSLIILLTSLSIESIVLCFIFS